MKKVLFVTNSKLKDSKRGTPLRIVNFIKQIRRENDVLETIFKNKEDELDYEYDFTLVKLKGKQFYTDVEVFQKVLDTIF